MHYDHDSMYGGHNKVQNKTKQKHEYSIITPKSIHVYVFNNDSKNVAVDRMMHGLSFSKSHDQCRLKTSGITLSSPVYVQEPNTSGQVCSSNGK